MVACLCGLLIVPSLIISLEKDYSSISTLGKKLEKIYLFFLIFFFHLFTRTQIVLYSGIPFFIGP
jgi:hypothetical protein